MSARTTIPRLISLSLNIALHPLPAATLLWALTKAPPSIRYRIIDTFASLHDPDTLRRVVKALKWVLAFATTRLANRKLNHLALNSWRVGSEKGRWSFNTTGASEVAVITGGCGGIGELVVKRLIQRGVRVAVLDVKELPASLQGYANITFFACDVTDPLAVNSTADRIRDTLGHPSILINNSGIANSHTIADTTPEFLRKIFDVNVLSNWYTVQAFLPAMVAANKGHIITVASLASFIALGSGADYSATKAAVHSFHEALNQELRYKHKAPNVLTTIVHPNWVRTPLIASFEKELRKAGQVILEPPVVADAIAGAVFGCTGGQVFLPRGMAYVSWLRGAPNWVQEGLRGGLAKITLGYKKETQ